MIREDCALQPLLFVSWTKSSSNNHRVQFSINFKNQYSKLQWMNGTALLTLTTQVKPLNQHDASCFTIKARTRGKLHKKSKSAEQFYHSFVWRLTSSECQHSTWETIFVLFGNDKKLKLLLSWQYTNNKMTHQKLDLNQLARNFNNLSHLNLWLKIAQFLLLIFKEIFKM